MSGEQLGQGHSQRVEGAPAFSTVNSSSCGGVIAQKKGQE